MKIIAITGYSGSGKTTLIEKVIPALTRQGLRVALVKHAHDEFDIDAPGKDSHRHRVAGATEVLITSSKRWALMHELRDSPEPSLEEQLRHLSPCDVVIIEGWKHHPMQKIEVHRKLSSKQLLFPNDPNVIAIATDESLATDLPQFALNDGEAVAEFIVVRLGLRKAAIHLVR